MILESVSNTSSIAVAALLISVVSLWISPLAALAAVAGTIGAGYIAGVMHGPAALWLLALAGSAWSLRTAHGWPRLAAIGLAGTLGLLLGLHMLPGFSNPVLIRDAVLASNALP